MAYNLCLHCGEMKYGILCPCPKCGAVHGSDSIANISVDMIFSSYCVSRPFLLHASAIIRAINAKENDPARRRRAFSRYMTLYYPKFLSVAMDDKIKSDTDAFLAQCDFKAQSGFNSYASPTKDKNDDTQIWRFCRDCGQFELHNLPLPSDEAMFFNLSFENCPTQSGGGKHTWLLDGGINQVAPGKMAITGIVCLHCDSFMVTRGRHDSLDKAKCHKSNSGYHFWRYRQFVI